MTPRPGSPERHDLIARALRLEFLTVLWMVVEAGVAAAAGVAAHSLTLIAFAADSMIELGSAAVLIWRLTVEMKRGAKFPETLERRAARIGSVLLFLLATYVAAAAARGISARSFQQFSTLGLAVASLALPVMVALGHAKTRVADRIGSRALRADTAEAIACAYVSGAVVFGLAAQGLIGAWWVDSVTAFALVPFLVREALEAWRGDEC